METSTSKTSASEVLKLQQKCNELKQQLEDYRDEKRSLSLRVKELEADLDLRPTAHEAQKVADELRSKLLAAETVCEELMDENEDMKKELRDMEEQIEEMQDNFREDQAVEYTSIKKELDQTTKNCRILSFKLRKAERKVDQLEAERSEMNKKLTELSSGPGTMSNLDRIKHLEQDLKISNEVSLRLQKELEESNRKLEETNKTSSKKKPPLLATIGKSASSEGQKISRESLTRGGSQDDPVQLLRDLQDSLEREADLREQLRFAEEEAENLRKKVSRVEEDNESLVLQLKKMATRARSRKLSPTNQTLGVTPETSHENNDVPENVDEIKLQLELSEQEASVLRKKVEELEADNRKLKARSKDVQDKTSVKGPTKVSLLDTKSNSIDNQKLKPDLKKFLSRTPKKVSALTSRDQLKTMVGDLEKEITDILACVSSTQNQSIPKKDKITTDQSKALAKALKDLEELNRKFESTKQDFDNEKSSKAKVLQENEKLNLEIGKIRENLDKISTEKSKLQEQIDKLKKEQKILLEDKKENKAQLTKLKDQLKELDSKKDQIKELNTKNDSLTVLLLEKEAELRSSQETLQELKKIKNESISKDKKITDLESRLSKFESKFSESEKKLREQSKNLEIKVEKEKEKVKNLEDVQSKLEEDKKKLTFQIENLNMKIKGYENTIDQKDKLVKQLEESLAREREVVSATNMKIGELEGREISKLKDELSKKAVVLAELESKFELAFQSQTNLQDKVKKAELDKKNTKLEQEKKIKELEIDLQNERKKIEVLKANAEKEQKNRELELATLKNKIKKLEMVQSSGGVKWELDLKHYQESIERLDETITNERQKYDDLTAKYEILEEEHVVIKAKLVMEKETLENQFKNLKKEQDQLELELRTLRETYNSKQDIWIKEKLDMEQKIKDMSKVNYNGNDIDKQRLKALFEEKQSEVDQIKREYDLIHGQMDYLRKENDELNKKLDDYEKVNKIQRNISADSSAMENEIRQLRIRLNNADKAKKGEVGECKMRYEGQLNLVNQELQSLQNQVLRFKRERDNYKHMLETAQKTMGELKQSPKIANEKGSKVLHYDELEEAKNKIATLEQQISCMEDELSEARLESSRLKTELVSERSSWDVRLSELHSKVNELEEEKVLSSGRTKIVGLRTKMELAWQKEREEQQRLLQETATLARDLRQTLFEVERERDKERLEGKRKHDQFKKAVEEEQDETKRKITELQCDLLELRDAHAKLRTTNEKLRREKERYEKEREELRMTKTDRRRTVLEEDRKIEKIIEHVDVLKQLAPELFFSKEHEAPYTPTPPRRTKSKSRETSPAVSSRENSLGPEDKQQKIQKIMQMLVHNTEGLRRLQKYQEDEEERERLRRIGMRRATSTEAENVGSSRYGRAVMKKHGTVDRQGSLHRKSLSLEHNIQTEQKIWSNDNDDSLSSLQSLDSDMDTKRTKRDSSLDSRLSSGSTQSDIGDKKKTKSLISKLKSLTKSRSIDDQDPGVFSNSRNLGSKSNSRDNSYSEVNDERGSNKNLKDRITGIFRRSGSSSRSNSVERKQETSSTNRPLVRNSSSTNMNSGVN
ncbi:hypothetical protein ABEB36_011094 [Hypothenemus hampei]|uniref:Uncharacterized protein n=1 Tax=Hypothenemus hampei TaxID=57062 RepID=A0ABD1EE72_HYPHA